MTQNDNFEKLVEELEEKRKKDCNIFKILRVDNYEIRHSNFLTWLFDKNASHNIGTEFLKKFLDKAKIELPLEFFNKNIEIESEVKIEIIKNHKKRVGRIDILLTGEDFVCVIENKYGSFEHDNQCQDYKRFIEDKYKSKKHKYLVFLDLSKPSGFDSTEGRYSGYNFVSYNDILDILKKILEKKNSLEISSILLNQYVEILDKKYNKIDDNIKTFYENNPEFIDKMWNLDIEELKEDEKEAVYHLMEYHKILKNSFNNFVKENILEKIVNQEYIKIKGYNWACAIDLQSKYSNLFFTELDFPMVNKKLNIQLYMGITKAKSNWFENENFNKSEFWDELTKKGYSFCFTPYIKNGAGYPTICNFAVVTNNCSFIKDCSTIYKQLWKAHDVKNIRDNKELLDFLKKNFKDSYNIVIKNLKEYKGKKVYIYPAVCVKYEFSNDLSTITFDDVKNKIIEILEKFGNIETPTDLFIKSVNNTSS